MTSELESCAACGKADVNLKACGSCRSVKYCNVDCQKAHRSKHKQACKTRAAELFDEKLFTMPLPREECPICCIILPPDNEITYMTCCGKFICVGCRYCLTRDYCPFCNARAANEEESKTQLLERIEKHNDPEAMNNLAACYKDGDLGLAVDHLKAFELYKRASENGSTWKRILYRRRSQNGQEESSSTLANCSYERK